MSNRRPLAGGFLLTFCILAGAAWGILAGNPMQGILVGTAIGIAIAVLVWLADRRR